MAIRCARAAAQTTHRRAYVDGRGRPGRSDSHPGLPSNWAGPTAATCASIRWTAGNPADTGKYAAELVALTPDVIFASASVNVAAVQRISRSVPIVFANVIDPVGGGFVASLARPGGNTTGFSAFEYSLSGK